MTSLLRVHLMGWLLNTVLLLLQLLLLLLPLLMCLILMELLHLWLQLLCEQAWAAKQSLSVRKEKNRLHVLASV